MSNQFSFDELNTFSKEELITYIKRKHKERHPSKDGDEEEEVKERSLPYREYFGDMYLEPEEKERRIQMADDLEIIYLFLFAWALNNGGIVNDEITYSHVYKTMEDKYWDIIEPYLVDEQRRIQLSSERQDELEDSTKNYISRQTRHVVDNTDKHFEDDYFTSPDRARMATENQINAIANDQEMLEAIEFGYTSKTWVTMEDNRVRDTHIEVGGMTLPISEPFMVGDSLLMFPGDDSLGASEEELANCRCHAEYGNEFDGLVDSFDSDDTIALEKPKRGNLDLQFFADDKIPSGHMYDRIDDRNLNDSDINNALEFPLNDPYESIEYDEY